MCCNHLYFLLLGVSGDSLNKTPIFSCLEEVSISGCVMTMTVIALDTREAVMSVSVLVLILGLGQGTFLVYLVA